MNEILIQTAQECWDQLTRGGRLRPKDYDADLVDELRAHFGLSETKDFHSELRDISAQDLVETLLTVLKPLAMMMTDLLSLYEAIGATRTSEANLRIEFNFDPDARPFEFDVQAFRDWESTVRHVLIKRRFRHWEQGPAWKLTKVIQEGIALLATDHAETPPRLDPKMEWPPSRQQAPVSGFEDLDLAIARAWRVREEFLAEAVSRWPNREDYRTGFRDPSGGVDDAHIMVSDYWDHSIGEELRRLAVRAAAAPTLGISPGRAAGLISTLVDALDDAISELSNFERDVQEEIEDLIDVLSLPMWGKRHELYSAWIFTRIVDAIGIQRLSFVVKAGRFSFDFKGTELATFDSVDGPLSVWTELRTKYHSPVGHGRTSSIQPDFRIVRSPIDDPGSSILAVEVKQYLRSALRNPADALADYTGGLPQADVVLAAYGPVSPRVLNNLKPDARDRAHVVRYMRPGAGAPLNTFRTLIADRIPSEFISKSVDQPPYPGQVFARELGTDVRVELTWELTGVDLDLHAELSNDRTVDYRNAESNTETGTIRLEEDVRNAPGPEILHISGKDTVAVYVHAYSDDDLGTVGAKLRIVCGPLDATIAIPLLADNSDIRWCHALIVDSDKIQIIDESRPTRPI